MPRDFAAFIDRIVRAVGTDVRVSVHCHNDLGLAVANSITAIEAGARQVECTVNGIGERAGNASLEEIVMILKVRQDLLPYDTAIRTTELFPASQLLTSLISFGPQPNKAIVGRNAFAHEAGIHQDGSRSDQFRRDYRPTAVGVPESQLVLGKHSGRHALGKRCETLGYTLVREQLDEVYNRFIALADRQKGVMDHEIREIADHVAGKGEPGFEDMPFPRQQPRVADVAADARDPALTHGSGAAATAIRSD
jgi:2-isopropylmalate synthase